MRWQAALAGHARRRGPLAPLPAPAAAGDAGRPRARTARSDMAALILGSAFELFAEKNYSTVTVKNIADATAVSLSRDNDIDMIVFNLSVEGNIARVVAGEKIGTTISRDG